MAGSCPLNYGERSFEKCSLKYSGGLGEGFIWSSYAEKHLWHVEELRTSTMMLILPVFRVMTDSNPAFKVSQLSLTCLVAWLNFWKSASSCVICCGGKFEKSWRTYIKEADREKQTNSACVVLLWIYYCGYVYSCGNPFEENKNMAYISVSVLHLLLTYAKASKQVTDTDITRTHANVIDQLTM